MDRYGMTIPLGRPLAEQRGYIEMLVDSGYTDIWSSETAGTDAFVPIALASVWAPTARLGCAIVPAFTRGPALMAQSVAAMASAAPGRFVFGIGASSDVIVGRWNGLPFEKPLARTRDMVQFLKAALGGEKVTHDYETFSVNGFRLDAVPATPPPIIVGALRAGMLAMAGEVADGAVVNWLSCDDVRTVAPIVHAGGPGKEIAARIFVCPSTDAEAVRDAGRRFITAYLNVPVYRKFHEWLGREELGPMWDAWAAGDRKAALAAVPDRVVDELIVHGAPEACREHIQRYVANGIDTPVLGVMPWAGVDPEEAARLLAELTDAPVVMDAEATFPAVVARRAAQEPDRPFLVEVGGRTLTYAGTRDEAADWAARVAALGAEPGDTVAVMLPTSALAVVVWLGLASRRVVEVPVNTALRGRFLHHVLADSRASIAIVADRYLDQLAEVLDDVPALRTIVVVGAVPAGADTRLVPLAELPPPVAGPPVDAPAPWDIATIMYTSGTTGASKGVLVPWAQLHATAVGSMPFDDLGPDDVFYAPFALFHVTGKSACYTSALFGGAAVLREQFSTDAYWDDVRAHGCTTTVLMGAMAHFLHRQPARDDDVTTPLRNVLMAPLIPEVAEFGERFGLRVCTVFNMTEVSSPITSQGWQLHDAESCGRTRPGYECRVVDEHDVEVPHGTAGELVVRSAEPWTGMAGYWNNPEKTVDAWRNQWFHTGDLLRRDAAGNFTFVDRLKDAIRRRGENIFVAELEREVLEHPAVFEAAAFGVPSQWSEEDVMVAVVTRPGTTIDAAELVAFLEPRIPRYMVPRYVEVVDELPKTPTEKVRKAVLRERGATATTWDREAAAQVR